MVKHCHGQALPFISSSGLPNEVVWNCPAQSTLVAKISCHFSKTKSPPLQQSISFPLSNRAFYSPQKSCFFLPLFCTCDIISYPDFSGFHLCLDCKVLAMKTLGLVTLFQIFIFFNGGVGLSLFGQCSERNCYLPNGVLMDYPFGGYPGCGHPDFQLFCHGEDYPVIKINDTEYKVKKVSYPERTLRVVDKTAISSYCYLPNSTLNATIPPFQMLSHSTLVFFVHCKSRVQNYSQVDCTTNSSLVFADNDEHIAQAVNFAHSSNCTSIFQVPTRKLEPVDYTTTLTPDKYSSEAIKIMISGFWIKWDLDTEYDSKCRVCNSSHGICGYNVSDPRHFLCHCKDSPSNPYSCFNDYSSGNRSKTLIIASCVGGVSAIMAAVALYIILWLRKKRIAAASIANGSSEFGFTERDIHIPNLPEFTYQELQQATNFFDKSRELGDGGFGTVYLGKLSDGRTVAVKKLHENNSKRLDQFVNEARILSSVRHPNLVRLFGYCHERQNLLLVYEYVSNGTLFHHLHGKNRESRMISEGLPWRTRLNIALETANALAYLHFSVEPAIFHRDVKSTNILLDEDMHVKVADFGLSRLVALDSTHISTLPQGTPGYLDPGYYQSFLLTDRSDVYSFGVVLIELISGKKAVDTARDIKEIGLAHLAISKIQSGALHEIVDPDLRFEYEPLVKAMVTGVAELAFICLAMEKDDRPCMMEVVTQLHRIKQMGYGCPDCQSHVLGRIKGEAMCGRIDKLVLPCSANTVQAEAICRKFDKLALPCSGNSVQAEKICKNIDKLALPSSPKSVQASWPSSNPSPQLSS